MLVLGYFDFVWLYIRLETDLLYRDCFVIFFFFKQKTAYVVRISDLSSDVCSSDLLEMAPLEIRHRSVRPISAKHAQASRFLQQSLRADGLLPRVDGRYLPTVFRHADRLDRVVCVKFCKIA